MISDMRILGDCLDVYFITSGGINRLEIQEESLNCTAEPRAVAYVEASFDNVYVNQISANAV